MAQKPIVNNEKKGTGQREVRPVWNNAMRIIHQNFSNLKRNFVPKAVLTKTGKVPISTARQSSTRAAEPVSTARTIKTARPKHFVNVTRSRSYIFQKSHSPSRRPFYQQTALKNRNLNNNINTVKGNSVNTAKEKRVTGAVRQQGVNAVKSSACWVWRPKIKIQDHGDPQVALKDTGIFDSGCSRHMTGNKSYLTDYQEYDGGFVAFAGSSQRGKITGKGKIKTGKIDFEDVYFVKELKFNLFSVSQMCDRKNIVPRKNNMYSFDLKNVVPSKGLTCLFAKATNDESKLWHKRLGHVNFKTMNKLVKGNLVRGLPSKIFENDHTCVACQKGKQHKATLVTDDYSRFSWIFFLAKQDETSGILKNFITGIENQLNHKVKIIRCGNGTEFKNYEMNQFCGIKGIKREFSNARTLQQNGVAKRKNKTLIEAARTMLADSLLPIPFWAEAVNTACYVQNRVLVTKPHNKTLYKLLIGRTPIISFMRPFGCPVTILNTLDHLGKFDGKADEGFLVGYSINSKALRVFNRRTSKVEENLHVNFLENKPNVAGGGPKWLFDIDTLTNTMNYQPVSAGNRTNGYAGTETNSDAGQAKKERVPDQEYILLPLMHTSSYDSSTTEADVSSPKDYAGKQATEQPAFFSTPSPIKLIDLEATGIFEDAYDDRNMGAKADYNNLETVISVSHIPSTRVHKDHPKEQIIEEIHSVVQTRGMTKWNQRRNKKDQRGIVVRNKVRLVAQGHRQEEGIDYDEVFALVARIEAIRLFLAFASFMDFTMYQMDVKSAFLYDTIEEEVYVSQPPGFVDPEFPNRVYKVEKALYGLHQAPRACVKTASTPMETHKPLSKDADGIDVDLYRSMIGSLMYLTSSKPDIICLKGQPTLGLWYPKDSLLDLIAFSDSDYASATEYNVASNCSGQVLWLQNQLLDYGYNFMETKIHVDNESAICVVKNPVYHSKTKHIEIRHHFIRDSYEKKLIEMVKIHIDYNATDLLTKAFDVTRF
ncbi:putative ribonuclease H-like domain-containing protein [Tanacetum coccineum]